jgi:plasmid maintenance system antidote protein VapI
MPWKIHNIPFIRKRRGITAGTAKRRARRFGADSHSRLNLKTAHDLRVAELKSARRIEREIKPSEA